MVKQTKKTTKTTKQIVDSVGVLEDANLVHALSYFPFFIGPVAMYFLGKTDKKKAMHHIKYALLIAIAVCVLFFILNGFVSRLVSLAYLTGSAYLAWKAYNWEEVTIEILDTVEEKIAEKVKK